MRIFDETKTTELAEPDLALGYLKEDVIRTVIPAVEGVQEVGHREVIRTYPNGGQDLKWVVDIPGVKAQPERIEEEDIFVYIPYTEADLKEISARKARKEAVFNLSSSDYRMLKVFEAIVKANPDFLALAESMYPGEIEARDGYRAGYNVVNGDA